MALHSEIQIYIAGNPIHSFQKLVLHQELDAHHSLQLTCRMDILDKLVGELSGNTKNYLGEGISVLISSLSAFSGYKELQFKGVVTAINSTKGFFQSKGDSVVITAQSATVLADDGPHYASYNDVGLQEILRKTFAGYDKSKLETAIAPKNNAPLHYTVQNNLYNPKDCRLCKLVFLK